MTATGSLLGGEPLLCGLELPDLGGGPGGLGCAESRSCGLERRHRGPPVGVGDSEGGEAGGEGMVAAARGLGALQETGNGGVGRAEKRRVQRHWWS